MSDKQGAIGSMTGFARREVRADWGHLVWEVRSVNHRYLDVDPRLPDILKDLEPTIRERVGHHVGRGKVEPTARINWEAQDRTLTLDTQRLADVATALETIRTTVIDCRAPDALQLLEFPGVRQDPELDTQAVRTQAMTLLDEVLADLYDRRQEEGRRLAAMLTTRAEKVREHAQAVRQRIPAVRQEQEDRLRARLDELNIDANPDRVETELVMAAQRMDVAEEMDRLEAHVEALHEALTHTEPVGRRLDFLMQEFNREANTLGSKSSDAKVSRHAVEMKVLIEQMREQVQNIE